MYSDHVSILDMKKKMFFNKNICIFYYNILKKLIHIFFYVFSFSLLTHQIINGAQHLGHKSCEVLTLDQLNKNNLLGKPN